MKHPRPTTGQCARLAREVANYRYDALAEFLTELVICMENDALDDVERGRRQLYEKLSQAAMFVGAAATGVQSAWAICEKHAPVEPAAPPNDVAVDPLDLAKAVLVEPAGVCTKNRYAPCLRPPLELCTSGYCSECCEAEHAGHLQPPSV